MDDRHQAHHFASMRRLQLLLTTIPAPGLQVQARDIHAILRGVRGVFSALHALDDEGEVELVNGQRISTSVRLQRASHESLWIVEPGQPERRRLALFTPTPEEIHPAYVVLEPRRQRFKTGVCHTCPQTRRLVVLKSDKHVLEISRHDNKALDGLP